MYYYWLQSYYPFKPLKRGETVNGMQSCVSSIEILIPGNTAEIQSEQQTQL